MCLAPARHVDPRRRTSGRVRTSTPLGSAKLRTSMLVVAFSHALGQTLALLATFVGIGVVVNVLILYVIAQVFAEHKQNQEREPGAEV